MLPLTVTDTGRDVQDAMNGAPDSHPLNKFIHPGRYPRWRGSVCEGSAESEDRIDRRRVFRAEKRLCGVCGAYLEFF